MTKEEALRKWRETFNGKWVTSLGSVTLYKKDQEELLSDISSIEPEDFRCGQGENRCNCKSPDECGYSTENNKVDLPDEKLIEIIAKGNVEASFISPKWAMYIRGFCEGANFIKSKLTK